MKRYIRLLPENVDFVLPYVLALLWPFVAYVFVLHTQQYGLSVNTFLVMLLGIPLITWHGGMRPALIGVMVSTTLIVFPFVYFYFVNNNLSLTAIRTFIDACIFVTVGVLIGHSVEIYKRTDREHTFRIKEKEYLQTISELQKDNIKLEKEVKARDEFLSIASHELKTPLTSMLLQLQTALHNIQHVSLAQFSIQNLLKMLENAEQQTKRVTRMVRDLLNVSLITTGKMELEKEEFDLSIVTRSVVEQFEDKFEKNGGVVLDADKAVVGKWDKLRIEQVLTNLISNAIKYGDDKPIEVTVDKNSSYAKITVTDHGIGIPKQAQKRIFERFERAVANNNIQGLGVGLYISYQIVKAHNGSIQVKSKEGKGSSFIVELPFA